MKARSLGGATGLSVLAAATTVVIAFALDLLVVSMVFDGDHGDFSAPIGLLMLVVLWAMGGAAFGMVSAHRLMPHTVVVFLAALAAVATLLFVLPLPGEDGGSVASGPYGSAIADGLTVVLALAISVAWLGGAAVSRVVRPRPVIRSRATR